MDSTVSEAHPETMDLLSRAWCSSVVHEALQPELQGRSLVLRDSKIMSFETDQSLSPILSWIWMQQAMHPELNYNSCFRKKWLPWKIVPFRHVSIKKWLKEIKQKRKEDQRLQRAEVHAAISVAGVAAALAAIAAAENSNHNVPSNTTSKEAVVASAAALVAAECAKVAEAMGAKREQISTAIGSAMCSTNAGDVLTLTAAAATSLRGAATLKARSACKNRLSGSAPVLPIEDNDDHDFDFEKGRSLLAKGAKLAVETPDGRCMTRSVSITLNSQAKVVLKIKKLNLLNPFGSKEESIILDQQTEWYKDSEGEENTTCFLIVLTANRGIIKLDMADDYQLYKMWTTTIDNMLTLSTSITKYEP
ncbi:hypothetical protein RJ640_024139 [Escallonia rubra]|uniref:VAN3-binding protein n=1 Tax=Escallonia rubra TaxID=112253 RepID=A0AA88QXF3_9ASTE|nr:hypothetical protein RJ640_024139 [Escallonia rubra]